jgi:hypothetical protein
LNPQSKAVDSVMACRCLLPRKLTFKARSLADEQNILRLRGSFFGSGQERFLRFTFANAEVH